MRIWALIVATACLVGCGSDDDGDDGGDSTAADGGPSIDGSSADPDASALECGAHGEGSTAGTVGGETVSPVSSAFTLTDVDYGRVIVVGERSESCNAADAPGESVVLLFCDPNISMGEYTVVSEQAFPDAVCPGEKTAMAVIEDNMTGGDIEDSVSGTITIDGLGDCLSGSFDVTFTDDNTMTGQFSAVSCE